VAVRSALRVAALPLAVGLALASTAHAATFDAELAALDDEITQIGHQTEMLSRHAAPGRAFVTEGQAVLRYEDSLYAFMIGDYSRSAEGFFSLVTTAALTDAGLHHDSEWYLAESLLAMGNLESAEVQYRVIAEDPGHPFRDDGVRRLLEVLGRLGQTASFYELYEREIVLGGVRPSDAIRYSVAKSFYQQDDMVKAKSQFLDLVDGSAYYHRARYFLGAIMVREGNLDAAAGYFRENVDMSVDSDDDRRVLDLSLLALGRVYYELGRFDEATDFYGRVGGDSDYLADKLYEVVWCFIKQGEFGQAEGAVDIFLLAYPEHEYTAQLTLLQGHLYVKEVEYDQALVAYEDVITAYQPVATQFGVLAAAAAEPAELFRGMLSGQSARDAGIPPYAYAMMEADPDISSALAVYRELEAQEEDIAESEKLIEELEVVLGSNAAIGGFELIRYEAVFAFGVSVQRQLSLLALEEQWLLGAGRPADEIAALAAEREALLPRVVDAAADDERQLESYRAKVTALQEQRAGMLESVGELEGQVAELRGLLETGTLSASAAASARTDLARAEQEIKAIQGDLDALVIDGSVNRGSSDDLADVQLVSEEVRRLVDRYAAQRKGARLVGDPLGGQFDSLHRVVRQSQDAIQALLPRLGNIEGSEVERIRSRFAHEVEQVDVQRTGHAALLGEAASVSEALTRAGFGRLEDFFTESVLRADMGVVDVYWAQKLDAQAEREDLVARKLRILDQLDARFEVIRQKMSP
jgi:TolA-binding protein